MEDFLMSENEYISINEIVTCFCIDKIIFMKFIDFGLFEIEIINHTQYIALKNIDRIKQVINLYKSLGVNKEGIDIILSMKEQIVQLKNENSRLKRRIDRIEQEQDLRNIKLPQSKGIFIEL